MQTNSDIFVIGLCKGKERYIWLYTDDTAPYVHRQLGTYASDPELSFNWCDAAAMSIKVSSRHTEQGAAQHG